MIPRSMKITNISSQNYVIHWKMTVNIVQTMNPLKKVFIPLIEIDNNGNLFYDRTEQLQLLPKNFLFTHYFNRLTNDVKENINKYIFEIKKSMNKHMIQR